MSQRVTGLRPWVAPVLASPLVGVRVVAGPDAPVSVGAGLVRRSAGLTSCGATVAGEVAA